MFDGRPLLTVPTPRGGEERFLSTGCQGKFFEVNRKGGGQEMRKKSDIVCDSAEDLKGKITNGDDRTD